MKILAAQLLLGAAILAAAARQADETREPPQLFSLEVGGKRIPLELDRPLDLETRSSPTRVVLRSEPHRVFEFAGLRFNYPRDMKFEADLETPGAAIWTLDGNDAVLMVQRHEGQADPAAVRDLVAGAMVDRYGKAGTTREPSKVSLGKRELEGTAIRVTLAGARLSQELYSIRSGKDSVVLVLQDSLNDDGGHTDGYRRMLEMLAATFQFPSGK